MVLDSCLGECHRDDIQRNPVPSGFLVGAVTRDDGAETPSREVSIHLGNTFGLFLPETARSNSTPFKTMYEHLKLYSMIKNTRRDLS